MIKIGNKIESNNLSNNLFDINKSNNDNQFGNILNDEIIVLVTNDLLVPIFLNPKNNDNFDIDKNLSNNIFDNQKEIKIDSNLKLENNEIIIYNENAINNNFKENKINKNDKIFNDEFIINLDDFEILNEQILKNILPNDKTNINKLNFNLPNNFSNNHKKISVNNDNIENDYISTKFNKDITGFELRLLNYEPESPNKNIENNNKINYNINTAEQKNFIYENTNNYISTTKENQTKTLENNNETINLKLIEKNYSYNKVNNNYYQKLTNNLEISNSDNQIEYNINNSDNEINNSLKYQSKVKKLNTNNDNINQITNIGDNVLSEEISKNNFKHNLNPYFSQNIDFDQNTISIPDREKFENNSLKDNFNNSIINKNEFSYRLNKDNQTNQNPNNDLSKPKIANNINKTDDKYFFANVLDNLKTNNLVNKDINNIDKSLNINNYNLSINNLKENLIKFIKYDIKDDNFKAKINLQPKSLGNLLIEISQNQGNINIQFNVDNQDTVKLIDNTLYNFKDRLIQSGLLNNNNDVNINIQLNLTNYNQNENQRNNSKQYKVNKKYSIENITNTAIEKDTKTKIYNKFNGGKIVEKYI